MMTLGGGKWGKTLGVEWVGYSTEFYKGRLHLNVPNPHPITTEKVTLS